MSIHFNRLLQANVQGLLNRCGLAGLSNPYGDPNQYRPGQGTQTFVSTTTVGEVVTRIYDGTTYYGGQTEVISGTTRIVSATAIAGGSMILPGTTTWVSETPRILSGTSAALSPTAPPSSSHTAAHIIAPTENYNDHVSGGAIAGIVIGLLIMAALAGLLAACWRKKRHEYMSDFDGCLPHDINGPTRTVVTEKIEPVVVPSSSPHNIGTNSAVPAQTNYHMPIPTATTAGVHPIQHQTGVPINPTHSHTGVGINPIHPHIGVNNTVSNSVPPPPPITNSRMK
ncbi:hypothetical protein BGX27_007533 [Mortierella sp. AM989]|nr:hypothetical protein BGX27_007533 [Mortierella sp. AM989]